MKKFVTTLLTIAAIAALTTSAFAGSVRISKVYGGGGGGSTTAATYAQDYVELFNASLVPVDISSWTIEYGSAAGNWGSSAGNIFTFPPGTSIQPCKYVLVALGAASTNPAVPPVPSPDFSNATTNLSGSNGKVALFNAVNSNLACGSELAGTLEDKMAYGTGNCPEGTATGAFTTTTAAVRLMGGLTDTGNNSVDFSLDADPVPNNSSSPANADCLVTSTGSRTWGQIKSLYR